MDTPSIESILGSIHDDMARLLLGKIKEGSITAAEMKIALELVKHNQVDGGDTDRPNNPTTDLSKNIPFTSLDQELEHPSLNT